MAKQVANIKSVIFEKTFTYMPYLNEIETEAGALKGMAGGPV